MFEFLAPDEVAARVSEVDLDALAERGIEGLLLDVDNTLVGWGSLDMSEATVQWLARAKARFNLCLLSNSVRGKRMRRLAEQLDIPAIAVWGLGRKPFPGGVTAALALTGTSPERTALIGDQLLTDIAAGNRSGLHTIWVEKISSTEFIGTRFNRIIESYFARRLERAGLMPARAPRKEAGGKA
jgi:HAD superfamily phosphatase (TIGR01668 family)